MNKRSGRIVPTLLAAAVLLALTNPAVAQDASPPAPSDSTSTTTEKTASATNLDTVVVTGTRAGGRTVSSSLTPIDVISSEVLQQTGTIDLTQALERAIPSLNFPFAPASDTFAFQRPWCWWTASAGIPVRWC
jgi:iron complex outermembrane receptor protein